MGSTSSTPLSTRFKVNHTRLPADIETTDEYVNAYFSCRTSELPLPKPTYGYIHDLEKNQDRKESLLVARRRQHIQNSEIINDKISSITMECPQTVIDYYVYMSRLNIKHFRDVDNTSSSKTYSTMNSNMDQIDKIQSRILSDNDSLCDILHELTNNISFVQSVESPTTE